MRTVYSTGAKAPFRFNDHVVIEMMLMGVPDEMRTGRLVQVRKGKGAWMSDVFFIRLRDGSLVTFENVLIRHVGDLEFEKAFYLSNGRTPPDAPPQPEFEGDSEDTEYTINGKFPEVGFVIERPKQPDAAPRSFAITITQ